MKSLVVLRLPKNKIDLPAPAVSRCCRAAVALLERKLRVSRARLRTCGAASREVPIPSYARLQGDEALGRRMRDILVSGVSTRRYAEVMPAMAHAAGMSKSAVSRQVKVASGEKLKALMVRSFAST